VNSCVNSPEDGPVGSKHIEIRRYMNKIEIVTSVGFSFHTWFSVNTHILTGVVSALNAPSLDWVSLTDVYFDIRMSLFESSGTI